MRAGHCQELPHLVVDRAEKALGATGSLRQVSGCGCFGVCVWQRWTPTSSGRGLQSQGTPLHRDHLHFGRSVWKPCDESRLKENPEEHADVESNAVRSSRMVVHVLCNCHSKAQPQASFTWW